MGAVSTSICESASLYSCCHEPNTQADPILHSWEHTPEWQLTSKLLISKHQQVQLLEAASVLVAMNVDGQPTNDSDNSSSPAASGSSERDEDVSSPESTPPPQPDNGYRDSNRDSKRYSTASSAYSRSYQSVFSESAPNLEPSFAHYRHWSSASAHGITADPSLAESYPDEDPQELAAAVGLLSCSYGTPKSGPTHMPGDDVPPVPPLPQKYAREFAGYRVQADARMGEDSDDESSQMHGGPYEEFEGAFGPMDA